MKILCLASEIGYYAPGIVYEKLINGLSADNEVKVICPKIKNQLGNGKVQILDVPKYRHSHPKIDSALFAILGINVFDYIWSTLSFFFIRRKSIQGQDVIISFVSFHNYISILLGQIFAKAYKIKWIVYLVDAVPAPIGWEKETFSYKRQKNFIARILGKTNAVISANPQMLDYQLKVIGDYKGIGDVLYVSHSSFTKSKIQLDSLPVLTFMYAGSIYGPRKIDTLLVAFRQFLHEKPSAKLVFVGNYNEQSFCSVKDLIETGNIEIHSFVSDLSSYYKKASVLIDVNAFFDNDIYLSSKIVNYLPVLKPIICVTGDNSPARNLFVDDSSIIHCHHEVNEIVEGLRMSVEKSVDIKERKKYIELLRDTNIVSCFQKKISNIVSN